MRGQEEQGIGGETRSTTRQWVRGRGGELAVGEVWGVGDSQRLASAGRSTDTDHRRRHQSGDLLIGSPIRVTLS